MSENQMTFAPSRTVRTIDGATLVTLSGEIDIVAAIPLASRLDALSSGQHPDLVLDLRPVSFIDCAGLGVLCRTRNRVRARHGRLRLVTDSGSFLRVLRITGLGGVFEVHPHLPSPGGERPHPLPGTDPERSFSNDSSARMTA
ncbi:STAS domain-containing protein [Streptomyces sp. NPDC006622]|uniref:STAS domain-containing protein n=1 Tax=Streptomyces sp. NPDC006622 TaxID=3155459 RepID=UPI0033A713D7